jgi:hypothetical protein
LSVDSAEDARTEDEDILFSLGRSIQYRADQGKMALVRSVALVMQVSKQRVLRLLEQNTGEDPDQHRWRYVVKARGLYAYDLLRPVTPPVR